MLRLKTLFLSPLALLLLPALYQRYSTWGHAGTTASMYLLTGVTFLLFSIGLFSVRYLTLKYNWTDIFLLFFLTYSLCNSIVHHSGLPFCDDVLILLISIPLFVIFKLIFSKQANFSTAVFLNFLLISVLLCELCGYAQFVSLLPSNNQHFSVTGPFNNPNTFCAYLAVCTPVLLYAGTISANRYKKIITIFCSISVVFFGCLLHSRAALLSLIISSVIIIVKMMTGKRYKIIITLLISPILIFCIIFFSDKTKSDSAYGRILVWKISTEMIKQYPLTGLGDGNYKKEYNNYQAEYFKTKETSRRDRLVADENYTPFNEYYNILLENGLIGILIFLALLFLIYVPEFKMNYSRKGLVLSESLKISILSLLIIGCFSYPLLDHSTYMVFVVLIALISTISSGAKKRKILFTRTVKILGSCLLVLMGLFFVHRAFVFEKWFQVKKDILVTKNTISGYQSIFPYLKNNPLYLTDLGNSFVRCQQYENAIAVLEKAKELIPSPSLCHALGGIYYKLNRNKGAETNYLQASYIVPGKFKFKYSLLKFYRALPDSVHAKEIAREIIKMPIKIPSREIDVIKKEAYEYLNAPK